MYRTILALLIVFAPVRGNGQAVEDCVGITNDSYRLACFDNLFGDAGNSGSQPITGSNSRTTGVWDVSIDVNPLDDTPRVVLFNSSSEGQSSLGDPILLGIRCVSGSVDILINWAEFVGFDTRTSVRYRVGREDAISTMWNMSSDNEATFYPGNGIRLIEQMIAVDRTSSDGTFVAQVFPAGGNSITAIWNLYGLTEAVEPLRDACGW